MAAKASKTTTAATGTAGGDRPRLLLLDGHSLAYRAFYALPVENFNTVTGQPTNAIYGFTSMLANTLRDEQPTHLAVAFDVSRKTWRFDEYPEYKATRSKTPDEFRSQVELIGELLDAMRVPRFAVEGYEADDVIATLASQAEAAGYEVLIVTGDRDALQLVSEHVTVLYPTKGVSELTRFTPAKVEEKYGLTPRQYPDFAALRGDPSDNLPGIPGVGEKTAAKWILQFGSFAELVERAEEVKGKAGQNLREHLESVKLNRRLTELCRDVELSTGPDGLAREAYDRPSLEVVLDALEFRNPNFRERLFAADPGAALDDAVPVAVGGVEVDGRVLEGGELPGWLAEHGAGPLGLASVDAWALGSGGVSEIALASGAGPAVWFDPARLDEADEKAFAAWVADPARPKVLHNAKGAMRVFAEHGWRVEGVTMDTALAAYLIKPGRRSFALDALSVEYLGRDLAPAGAEDGQLAFGTDERAEADALMAQARTVLDLGEVFAARLEQDGALELLRDVELPTSAVLARMERHGIAADREWLERMEQQFAGAVQQAVKEAHAAVGHEFNLGSPKQLQEVLFGELGLPKTKKTKTGWTTDADALAWLAGQTEHELPVIMLRHREQARLRSTVEGLIKTIAPEGRIHTTFNQTVAATGRLSSTDPNLQNIPVRTDEGRAIRRGFVVGEGYESLLTADYSQIELRVMAHLSEDEGLIAAFTSGEDLHTTVGSYVFSVPPEGVDAEMRRKIKAMSYGLAYGLSAFGLSQQLGIDAAEARGLMDMYFERFGGVRDYLQRVVEEARVTGYTETLLGRRRYLPDLTSDNRQRREMAERMALNAPIQGSAADIVKIAMLRVDEALRRQRLRSRLLLQVHDEIVLEVAPGERAEVEALVRQEMSGAYPLRAPLDVSVGVGDDWEAAAH
ncbi:MULTISPECIES: DNA polymerase I [Streptomycetaceae]|uniref:DNA polymerase I n=1 Tax=Streptantibioticus cattleyicolor (strain ATCC 35852 / DSM 46488 / JCM 4925 / NBRC 14057 / NRRL 8057) TaxID=1003195 RepID=F8JZ21_STREN|nr:DNA polymerase I [Streptantibioticus cattleyicolor]AEW93503.1 DNA polymerase I [Streptantibioticus cattleyicolor NRRL 8057 = DSM 46488]MYS58213.1 DNA polymerase I [Streptomyces sp. SID5468]CCB73855.1 DNA polymerase I [Streptantibioticus cattleyicolor NRRL 8057 = DSM 46488]